MPCAPLRINSYTPAPKFLVAHLLPFARPRSMGAKYIPTNKDLKANKSFIKKQHPNHPVLKKASAPASKKGKKG